MYDREIFFWGFRGRRNIRNSLMNNEEYLGRLDRNKRLQCREKMTML